MTVAQAEEFYGPVRAQLRQKFKSIAGQHAGEMLAKEFGTDISEDLKAVIGEHLGPEVGDRKFEEIVRFMTGFLPSQVAEADKAKTGSENCLALVYKGMSAVEKIRYLLGQGSAGFGSARVRQRYHGQCSPCFGFA